MVSTRSHSRLSDSGIVAVKDAGDEVNSKGVHEEKRRRTSRSAQQGDVVGTPSGGAQLETIAEEVPPRSTTRKTTRGTKNKKPVAEDDQVDDQAKLVDSVADSIFAALEHGFASDGENSSSEESEGADDADDHEPTFPGEGQLRWQAGLRLPDGGDSRAARAAGGASTSGRAGMMDTILDGKSGGMYKLSALPSTDARVALRAARKAAPDTAGKAWYDLPATAITDEVKNDLRVLRLRAALDPKSFYKKFDSTKFPKYFQFGTVVEGATDFYSSRLTRRERKRTLTEEVMADPHLTAVRKKRYNRMQEEAGKWAGKKGRKTDMPRNKKKPNRPKH